MKYFRYNKHNKTLNIGGLVNKLAVFIRDRKARLSIGNRDIHFGNWEV